MGPFWSFLGSLGRVALSIEFDDSGWFWVCFLILMILSILGGFCHPTTSRVNPGDSGWSRANLGEPGPSYYVSRRIFLYIFIEFPDWLAGLRSVSNIKWKYMEPRSVALQHELGRPHPLFCYGSPGRIWANPGHHIMCHAVSFYTYLLNSQTGWLVFGAYQT